MTVMLPPHKVSRMLRYYFAGMPQTGIARRNNVDQSTVSKYAQRFKARADIVDLLAAGKEFGVMEEVNSLRSLAVEFAKYRLTVEGAKEGLRIIRRFQQLGVSPDEHQGLIRLCQKVKDQGFVDAALRLSQWEETAGMTYEQVVSRFEGLAPKVKSLEQRKTELEAQISEFMQSVAARRRELSSLRKEVEQAQKGSEKEKSRLERELKQRMAELDVTIQEVEEVGTLKAQLQTMGLDLPTLIELAKEFPIEDEKS